MIFPALQLTRIYRRRAVPHATALLAVTILTFPPLLFPSHAQAADPPGWKSERQAEQLEMRDESIAAQMEYLKAMNLAIDKAGESQLAWARVAFLAEKAFALTAVTGEKEDLLVALANLTHRAPPLISARGAWLRAKLFLRKGKPEDARDALSDLGLVRNYMIIGPFDNERGRSFDTALEPETSHRLSPAVGKKRQIRWRQHQTTDPLGIVFPEALFRPRFESLAYAVFIVSSSDQKTAALRIGSTGSFAAWVNRREVMRVIRQRPVDLDQNACGIFLEKGRNTILLKLGQQSGDWRFCVRITDPDGRQLKGLHFPDKFPVKLPEQRGREDEPTPPHRGSLTTLATRISSTPDDHRSRYMLGCLLVARHSLNAEERTTTLREAIRISDNEPAYHLALAEACRARANAGPDRDDNLRRLFLQRAILRGDEVVLPRIHLAEHYHQRMRNNYRAEIFIDQALTINPLSLRARLLRYDLWGTRDWSALASKLIAQLSQQHPGSIDTRLRAGAFAMARGTTGDALDSFSAALAIDGTNRTALAGNCQALLRLSRADEATALLKRHLKVEPYARETYLLLNQVFLRRGNVSEAAGICQRWLDICPDDHKFLALLGDCYSRSKEMAKAEATWKKALSLQPTFPALQEYLRFRGTTEESRTTTIDNLADFADSFPPTGESEQHLLYEVADRVNRDGTNSRTIHSVIRIRNREAAERLRHQRIRFKSDDQTARIRLARVLHADGRLGAARIYGSASSGYLGIDFPTLAKGDVIEMESVVDRFRPGFFGNYFGQIFYFVRSHPVMRSRYILTGKGPFYFHRTGGAPAARVLGGTPITRVWEMRDLPPVIKEDFMPPRAEVTPGIQVSTFANWNELAKWYWHLIEPQNLATPAIRKKVTELTRGKETDTAKLAAIYAWVTDNINNKAWSFGVHGYKPYSAGNILARGFGDCKDKSTLINVMAREVGLDAWPVLLRATGSRSRAYRGREDLTLPVINHFNHCISRVRIGNRDYFLDGTVRYRPLESLPYTDAGAKAIVITPEKGEALTLPAGNAESNQWQEEASLSISSDLSGTLSQTIVGTGLTAVYLRAYFGTPSRRDIVLRRLSDRCYGHTSSALADFNPENGKDSVRLKSRVRIRKYAERRGGAIFIKLPKVFLSGTPGKGASLPESMGIYARKSSRVHDLILPMPFKLQRRIVINWTGRYRLASKLTPVVVETDSAILKVLYSSKGSSLTIDYLLAVSNPRISKEAYPLFRRLCSLADATNRMILALEKK